MAVAELRLRAQDGYELGATLFEPAAPARRAVLVMPATGVPQTYYGKFAAFLAERGFPALTFDYRGIGRSRPASLRGMQARMRDWVLLDAAAATGFLQAKHEQLLVVGHSFGGQPLGQVWMWTATHVALPAVSWALGYFPGSRLGFGEDLPAGVAIEWASWCRNPRYVVGALRAEAAFARFSGPLLAYSISDDAFAPPAAVKALLELYPAASSEIRAVAPRDVHARNIGHFGFFRESFRDTLWRDAVEWLERR